MTDARRALPSVGSLLESDAVRPLLERAPRTLVADAVRDAVASARLEPAAAPVSEDDWRRAITAALDARQRASLRPVFNATGVVLHTNLGRAPLSGAGIEAISRAARGYSNLEYDVARGVRGSRYEHCVRLLCELTGAEDALVVNNGAAALMLALNTFAHGRAAIVSRGELIEIGGSFRIPEIMERSGARLHEVGTTNRTHARDYVEAIAPDAAVLVKVHRSNFAQAGYVAEVSAQDVAAIADRHGLDSIFDLGSGLLVSLEPFGLSGEPLAHDAVRSGASVVTMSGDKLLGGPQAGIVLGRVAAIDRMKRNPMTRALRVDKLTIAALEATLALYREPARALREIPTLRMLTATPDELAQRAHRLAAVMRTSGIEVDVVGCESTVGGGSFPTASLASWALSPAGDARALESRLREGATPVIGRVAGERLLLDLRSVPEEHHEEFLAAVLAALA